MKKYLILFVLGLIQLLAVAQNVNVKQFAFLAGNWEMSTKKGKLIECWIKSKDSLNGKSFRYDLDGKRLLTESLVIKKINGEFNLCVTGYEHNNTGITNFKLVSAKNKTFIFENKAHDFPQRIVYQDKGKERLLAWIEGELNGKEMKSVFPYTKVK